MRDAEFRAMLQASKERNKHNSYAYTNNPTSYELPKFTKKERKGIDEVIRAITPRSRYMPTRKSIDWPPESPDNQYHLFK